MSLIKKIKMRTQRRKDRVRKNIRKNYANNKIRISCFRSLNHFYAQAINDIDSITIASASTFNIDFKGNKTSAAFEVGKVLAAKLKLVGKETAILDRGSYLYHGRVKSFAEGLREGGIII